MPLTPEEIGQFGPRTPSNVVPAAFENFANAAASAGASIGHGMDARAEQERLWAAQNAQEQQRRDENQFKYTKLASDQQDKKDEQAQKLHDQRMNAAHSLAGAIGKGDLSAVDSHGPLLSALGMDAQLQDEPMTGGLLAFEDGIPGMTFGLGKTKLHITADGQPFGSIDVSSLQDHQRAAVEPVLRNAIEGASQADRPALQAAADAQRSSPEMIAQGAPEVLKQVTGIAEKQNARRDLNDREQLRAQEAQGRASASAATTEQARAQAQAMQQQRIDVARHELVHKIVRGYVNDIAGQNNFKKTVEQEQSAVTSLADIDAAIRDGRTLTGGTEARTGIARFVTSMHGKNSSDREGKQIFSGDMSTDAQNLLNYVAGGGALAADKLQALRAVLAQDVGLLRARRQQAAATAQQMVNGDSTLQKLVPGEIQHHANQAARQLLGASPPVSAPRDTQNPDSPGSSMENQGQQLRNSDPEVDDRVNHLLGGP